MRGRSLAQLGTAVIFLSHGCAALLTSGNVTAEWVGWIVHFLPVSHFQGAVILKAIGTLDISLALYLIASPVPSRWVALWCICWAALTASMRFYFYDGVNADLYFSSRSEFLLKPFGEVLVRVFNIAMPFFLLRERLGKPAPSIGALMKLLALYFLGTVLLEYYRLLNYPGEMVFSFNLFTKGEFLALMGVAATLILGFSAGQLAGKMGLSVLAALAFGHELWVNLSFLEFDLMRASGFYAAVQFFERMGVIFALAILLGRAGIFQAIRGSLGKTIRRKAVSLHGEGR